MSVPDPARAVGGSSMPRRSPATAPWRAPWLPPRRDPPMRPEHRSGVGPRSRAPMRDPEVKARRAIRGRRKRSDHDLVRAREPLSVSDGKCERRLGHAHCRAEFARTRAPPPEVTILFEHDVDEPDEGRVAKKIEPGDRRRRVATAIGVPRSPRRCAPFGSARRGKRIEERARRVARKRNADPLLGSWRTVSGT